MKAFIVPFEVVQVELRWFVDTRLVEVHPCAEFGVELRELFLRQLDAVGWGFPVHHADEHDGDDGRDQAQENARIAQF